MEVFGWRKFKNGKKVGGYSGMTGTPYDSGESQREQGISKAGNRRMRKMAWRSDGRGLRFQPNSELSRWFHEKYANGGKRMRRIGIVAVARKLLVVLWRYLEKGVMPKGAELKPRRNRGHRSEFQRAMQEGRHRRARFHGHGLVEALATHPWFLHGNTVPVDWGASPRGPAERQGGVRRILRSALCRRG